MLTFGSLFAGIGGFDLGFELAGMEPAWQVEIADHPTQILEKHWPNVERHRDVKEVGKRNLSAVDLICGGFPCQDVSVAGNRKGLAGERSGLWFEFYRILDEMRPQWVVIENVPGLLSSNEGRDFAVIIRGLVELRYGVAWRILDAQNFGVAQRRRRVFIVGRIGDGRAAEILFEPTGSEGDSEKSRKTGAKAADDVAKSLTASQQRLGDGSEGTFVVSALDVRNLRDGGNVSGTLQAKKNSGHSLNYQNPVVIQHASIGRKDSAGPQGKGWRDDGKSWTLDGRGEADVIAFDWQSGGDVRLNISNKHTSALQASQTPAVVNTTGHQGDRVVPDTGVWPALSADSSNNGGGANALLHSRMAVRRLTPTECERLQGFPDGWTEGLSDSARYRALGNAVCVPVVEWIGKRIGGK